MIFDAHGDILTDMYQESLKKRTYDSFKQRHLEKYIKGDIKISIFVNYTDPYKQDKLVFNEIFAVGFKEIELNQDIFGLVLEYKDIERFNKEGKIAVIIGVEGIKYLSSKDELIKLYKQGLRHLSLTWNEANDYGCGILGGDSGLSDKGKEILDIAKDLGMIIDLAHANESTFFDVINYVKQPIIVSHANIRNICFHPRNLTDEQLLAIKATNGVIGLTNVANFIAKEREDHTVKNLAKHIDYAIKLLGVDHVGLGFDICYYLGERFNNTLVKDFEDISKTKNLIKELKSLGYNEEDLDKIKYKNFLRVVKEVLNR